MADPKYAGLPGIAVDQPDMYESSDQPEYDQEEESDTESLETLHLSSVGCLGELEVGGDRAEETIAQRFQRLQCEVAELLQEMDSMPESSRETELAGVAIQVDGLSKQLSSCQVHENLGGPSPAPPASLSQQISSLSQHGPGSSLSLDPPGPADDVGLYQLYLRPGPELDAARMARLDNRLSVMEAAVGAEGAGVRSVLSTETQRVSLSRACAVLAVRRPLLDTSHLDHVEGRLAALTYKMNAISDQKKAVKTATESGKVSKLYDMIVSSEGLATVLPSVLDRLDTVQELEKSASGWSDSLVNAEHLQRRVEQQLTACGQQQSDTQQMGSGLGQVADRLDKMQKKIQAAK